MKLKVKNIEIYVENIVLVFIFVIILSEKIRSYFQNYLVCYLFILFHELAHITVAAICSIELKRINIRLCGINAVLNKRYKLSIWWILIYLAGPMSNILLAMCFRSVKFVFEINVALAMFNMICIPPLDGYNILKILLEMILPKRYVNIVLLIIKNVILILLILLGGIALIGFHNPSILLFTAFLATLGK